MRALILSTIAFAISLPSCKDKAEYSEFENAESTGRKFVDAIRHSNSSTLYAGLTPEASAETSTEEIAEQLTILEKTCGKLAEPSLFDVKVLSEEDFPEGENPRKGAVQVYAAMLCESTGSDGAAGVDLKLRLVPANGIYKLLEWDYEPVFHSE